MFTQVDWQFWKAKNESEFTVPTDSAVIAGMSRQFMEPVQAIALSGRVKVMMSLAEKPLMVRMLIFKSARLPCVIAEGFRTVKGSVVGSSELGVILIESMTALLYNDWTRIWSVGCVTGGEIIPEKVNWKAGAETVTVAVIRNELDVVEREHWILEIEVSAKQVKSCLLTEGTEVSACDVQISGMLTLTWPDAGICIDDQRVMVMEVAQLTVLGLKRMFPERKLLGRRVREEEAESKTRFLASERATRTEVVPEVRLFSTEFIFIGNFVNCWLIVKTKELPAIQQAGQQTVWPSWKPLLQLTRTLAGSQRPTAVCGWPAAVRERSRVS